MELNYNYRPRFTEWVTASGLLECPFVLLDAGVNGGVHPRWGHLGPRLEVHGFDALPETIEPLAAARRPGHHYHATALGDRDGRTTIFVPINKFAASLAPRQLSPEQSRLQIDPKVSGSATERDVPLTRLDTLLAEGAIPPPDFLKLDCEGSEPAILRGAAALLASPTLVGVQAEASFLPGDDGRVHFGAIFDLLRPHNFRVADIALGRFPYKSFAARARLLGDADAAVGVAGPVAALEVLFIRDFTATAHGATPETLLKSAIMLELYGLNDAAYDMLTVLADRFPVSFDVAAAADRLVYRPPAAITGIKPLLRDLTTALRRSGRYRLNRRGLR